MATSSISKIKAPKYKPSAAQKTAINNYSKGNSVNGSKSVGWYNKAINGALQSAKNMGKFSTDKSSYYQSAYGALKDAAMRKGQQAMKSTMANAATYTGGYSNSYATTAGAASYQDALNALSAQIPSLIEQASSMHANEKNDYYSYANALASERNFVDTKNLNLANLYQSRDYNNYSAAMDDATFRINRLNAIKSAR